jgi:phospholipase/carboxylesterase
MPLDGPRLRPRSGPAKQLVVLLHGYGSDGNDLIALGQQWQRWLPDAAFVAPHAPERCAMAPSGRQWFGLSGNDPGARWRGVNAAGPGLDEFLQQELDRHQLPPPKLALVGFSQGTMMALHVGLRRAVPPAGIVAYSGMLVGEQQAGAEASRIALSRPVATRPPILLVHGEADDVVPVDALFMTADALATAEVPCQWHLSAGIGHSIDADGLRHGGLFLVSAFGLPFPAR